MKEAVRIQNIEVLAKDHFSLEKVKFSFRNRDGEWKEKSREVYHMGNAATVLLYSKEKKTVLLMKQFRIPSFLNGNPDGMLIETCAGKLDNESPEEGIIREIEEETGYKVPSVHKVFEAYMTQGYVSEIIYFFIAEYDPSMKVSEGGGLKEEGEDIEVLEIPFEQAISMMNTGTIKDAKTILLLQYAQIYQLLG